MGHLDGFLRTTAHLRGHQQALVRERLDEGFEAPRPVPPTVARRLVSASPSPGRTRRKKICCILRRSSSLSLHVERFRFFRDCPLQLTHDFIGVMMEYLRHGGAPRAGAARIRARANGPVRRRPAPTIKSTSPASNVSPTCRAGSSIARRNSSLFIGPRFTWAPCTRSDSGR